MLGDPLPGRVAGSNLIRTLTGAAANEHRSVFLLGGDESVADEAAQTLTSEFPDLEVAGVYCPPFGFEKDPGQTIVIKNIIEATAPDIVFVALGFPKQEILKSKSGSLFPMQESPLPSAGHNF